MLVVLCVVAVFGVSLFVGDFDVGVLVVVGSCCDVLSLLCVALWLVVDVLRCV